ncbi:Protocatechuate 4,5-dioxygenase beta chain [Aquimixticola soesokkakensis]|uniref:Protocatechuate 4,5-dioxygenase beta chain n=1 Tax=Aquimixticola soesokkakensis TaxID=1519096 RepID=A0A1Y5SR58_9RHOB|nr:class III extradiol dioxygenase family protein [Aquimixticola soesokkakensis]SLN45158.1 Protocatechuate 4,5-dioxygenase beta chain [Aquimixticola soesokkakensis]
MARILGGITTSHIPAVGHAIANELFEDPYWKPFFAGYPPIHEWLAKHKPDVVINIYNDHGLGLFLDKMPTFAIGAALEYQNADEGWGLKQLPPFKGDAPLSWHIIEGMVEDEFDICSCQELPVDHGFTVPMQLFWPGLNENPNMPRAIPISANTVQHPIPTLKRALDFGKSLRKAVLSWPEDVKVVVLGTGGLSHQLDGERAGFINKDFDTYCMDKIVSEPEELTKISRKELVRQAGAQGTEFLMWMMMRGALGEKVNLVNKNYHLPISNTGAGTMLMECMDEEMVQAAE